MNKTDMDIVIAIDPGSEKTGLAAVAAPNRLLRKAVVPTEQAATYVARWLGDISAAAIVIGDGTRSAQHRARLAELPAVAAGVPVVTVDERHTTEMATARYWREHPPRGWRRWIPTAWQTPPVPVDDYAAWILAEKYYGCEMPEPLSYLEKDS